MECPEDINEISSNVSFKTCVSLLIFCFDDLSIGVRGMLKSPTIIVLLSISPFMSVSVCLWRRQWHPTPVLLPGTPMNRGAWWAAVHEVAKSQTQLSDFTLTFHFHALEKEMATNSSVLAWRIPGIGEPGGLLSKGSHKVGHS